MLYLFGRNETCQNERHFFCVHRDDWVTFGAFLGPLIGGLCTNRAADGQHLDVLLAKIHKDSENPRIPCSSAGKCHGSSCTICTMF